MFLARGRALIVLIAQKRGFGLIAAEPDLYSTAGMYDPRSTAKFACARRDWAGCTSISPF